jgi:hypothetical protein
MYLKNGHSSSTKALYNSCQQFMCVKKTELRSLIFSMIPWYYKFTSVWKVVENWLGPFTYYWKINVYVPTFRTYHMTLIIQAWTRIKFINSSCGTNHKHLCLPYCLFQSCRFQLHRTVSHYIRYAAANTQFRCSIDTLWVNISLKTGCVWP